MFQIESLLDQTDKKLLTHILKVFSNEKDGISILLKTIAGTFFVDKYDLEIVGYIFDLFIVSSNEFSNVHVPLPSIDTWRNWICTCILLDFSTDLLKLSWVFSECIKCRQIKLFPLLCHI